MGRYRALDVNWRLRVWSGSAGCDGVYEDESPFVAASMNHVVQAADSSALMRSLNAAATSARCGLVRDGAVVSAATSGRAISHESAKAPVVVR